MGEIVRFRLKNNILNWKFFLRETIGHNYRIEDRFY